MSGPLVYLVQNSLPKALKPLHLMKCQQLQESLRTKRFKSLDGHELQIKIDILSYQGFLDAWEKLESELEEGETKYCSEVSFDIGFEKADGQFLTIRKLPLITRY